MSPSNPLTTLLRCCVVTIVLAAVAIPATGQVRYRDRPEPDPEHQRLLDDVETTAEIFRLDCSNDYYRREVTLFGGGTIRVREGLLEEPEMWLGELDRRTTAALVERLREPDLSEVPQTSRTVVGDWVETCRFEIAVPGEEQRVFTFRRLDALPLELQKSLSVAIATMGMVDRTRPPDTRWDFPHDYRPQEGDVLVASDGRRFRISGFTTGRVGAELVGVDHPVVLLVAVADLTDVFVSLEEAEH